MLVLILITNTKIYFYKINLLNDVLINSVLINGVVLIHPICMYITYVYYLVFFFNFILNYKFINKYILFIKTKIQIIVLLSFYSLFLGSYWAQQELN